VKYLSNRVLVVEQVRGGLCARANSMSCRSDLIGRNRRMWAAQLAFAATATADVDAIGFDFSVGVGGRSARSDARLSSDGSGMPATEFISGGQCKRCSRFWQVEPLINYLFDLLPPKASRAGLASSPFPGKAPFRNLPARTRGRQLAQNISGTRYGTGSGSDLALPEERDEEAPGRYRSLYHVRQDNDK